MAMEKLKLKVKYPKALIASIVVSLLIVALLFLVQPYAPPAPQNPFSYLSYKWWMWWMFPSLNV
jgi:hypothetical protein